MRGLSSVRVYTLLTVARSVHSGDLLAQTHMLKCTSTPYPCLAKSAVFFTPSLTRTRLSLIRSYSDDKRSKSKCDDDGKSGDSIRTESDPPPPPDDHQPIVVYPQQNNVQDAALTAIAGLAMGE
jgi:hypothetical protein